MEVIDICSKYAWVVPLKHKKVLQFLMLLKKMRQITSQAIWVHKSSELYSRSMKSCLQDNDVAMYSTIDKGKSVVTETFIRTKRMKYDFNIQKRGH